MAGTRGTAVAEAGGQARNLLIKPARTGGRAISTRGGDMLNTKLVSWALGVWGAITFVVCVLYGLITPESLHMHAFLEQVLPGFKWLTWWGFLLGLAESFLYGVYAGLVFCPVYNWLGRRWGGPAVPQ
jgi:hypothetical protein